MGTTYYFVCVKIFSMSAGRGESMRREMASAKEPGSAGRGEQANESSVKIGSKKSFYVLSFFERFTFCGKPFFVNGCQFFAE